MEVLWFSYIFRALIEGPFVVNLYVLIDLNIRSEKSMFNFNKNGDIRSLSMKIQLSNVIIIAVLPLSLYCFFHFIKYMNLYKIIRDRIGFRVNYE